MLVHTYTYIAYIHTDILMKYSYILDRQKCCIIDFVLNWFCLIDDMLGLKIAIQYV